MIVANLSEGLSSAYTCKLIKDKYGGNAIFIFMDTGAEHPETYEFIRKVNDYLDLNLVHLKADFNQPLGEGHTYECVSIDEIGPDLDAWRGLVKKYGTPGISSGWCTSRMKEEINTKFMNDHFGKHSWDIWLGMRADEPIRIWGDNKKSHYSIPKRLKVLNYDEGDMIDMWREMVSKSHSIDGVVEKWNVEFDLALMMVERVHKINVVNRIHYLAEISDFDKEDVKRFWDKMPFTLSIPEWLGNCVFCFKKSDLKLAAAAIDEPKMLSEFIEMLGEANDGGGSQCVMYRKKRRLEQVIGMFDGLTGDEIKSRIRGSRQTDANSCSESCEPYHGV